jgi:hypothetical protein
VPTCQLECDARGHVRGDVRHQGEQGLEGGEPGAAVALETCGCERDMRKLSEFSCEQSLKLTSNMIRWSAVLLKRKRFSKKIVIETMKSRYSIHTVARVINKGVGCRFARAPQVQLQTSPRDLHIHLGLMCARWAAIHEAKEQMCDMVVQ